MYSTHPLGLRDVGSVITCADEGVRQPGNPNGNTLGGYGAMMEVGYVAQYSS